MNARRPLYLVLAMAVTGSLFGCDAGGRRTSAEPSEDRTMDFNTARGELPAPIFDENPALVRCYWKAWELAFANVHTPAPGSGFVSPFIDASFNENIFLWDTAFMTMFCNYAHPYIPGIVSLDNFYAKQHETGEICREIDRTTGKDYALWVNRENRPLFSRCGWGGFDERERGPVAVEYRGRTPPAQPPRCTLDALNNPVVAWAELESYRVTGDLARLERVYPALVRYYEALDLYLKQGDGLYITDWASMDNSPRNRCLTGGGTAVDTSAQMVLFARQLAEIAQLIDRPADVERFAAAADETSDKINALLWSPDGEFYFDRSLDGTRCTTMTIAAYWTLLAGVASPEQAESLVDELADYATFRTRHRVPTLAASDKAFEPSGGYWRGSVWAPTNVMVVRGLERSGYPELAREIALEHLDAVVRVFEETGTIWENYSPTSLAPGDPAQDDFVGWSGLGPIAWTLEYAIGLKADAPRRSLVWDIRPRGRVGVERFWFGGVTTSLICGPRARDGRREVRIESDGDYSLEIRLEGRVHRVDVAAGKPRTLRL